MSVGLGLKMKHESIKSVCCRLQELPSKWDQVLCNQQFPFKQAHQEGYVLRCTRFHRLLSSSPRCCIHSLMLHAYDSTQCLLIIFLVVCARGNNGDVQHKTQTVVNSSCLSVHEWRSEGTIQWLIHFLSSLHFLLNPVYVSDMASESPVSLWWVAR